MKVEKAAFMGRITAGVTHEIKNVLAIIKESAGLMEDLICLGQDGSPFPRDKFLRTLTRISDQVTRGVDLSTTLNEFAHTSDQKTATIDLNQAVAQVVLLCQRFARLKEISLIAVPHIKAVSIVTDPLALQILLFNSLELLMDAFGKGAIISMGHSDTDGTRIMIFADTQSLSPNAGLAQDLTEAFQRSDLRELAAELNMFAEVLETQTGIAVGVKR
jgi:C4-dicarboxylate-specific signal transduction histidine kinase